MEIIIYNISSGRNNDFALTALEKKYKQTKKIDNLTKHFYITLKIKNVISHLSSDNVKDCPYIRA